MNLPITTFLGLAASVGIGTAAPQRPFPQHVTYTPGILKPTHVSQPEMDAAVVAHYDAWKANYVKTLPNTEPLQKWIKFDKSDSTVSEAIGYGMVIAAYMADHAGFDAMLHYVKAHPSRIGKNLTAWKQSLKDGSMQNVSGPDSATDGDMDIAYALILADRQWGSNGPIHYQKEALRVLTDLLTYCVNPTDSSILPGDWASQDATPHSRASDYMVDHLLAYADFDTTHSTEWMKVYNRITTTVNHQFANGSGETGLMADFYVKSGSDYIPVTHKYLETPHDGDCFYNACRIPWRLPMAYILTGKKDLKDPQVKMANWISRTTDKQPRNIKAGYWVTNGPNGNTFGNYNDLAFTAPFAVNAMLGNDPQWLNRLWTSITGSDFGLTQGYYADAIRLQVLLVVSGNWWLPTH